MVAPNSSPASSRRHSDVVDNSPHTVLIEYPDPLGADEPGFGGPAGGRDWWAGGLGLIGGGYGATEWLRREFDQAGEARVGCGFITRSLARSPELLDLALVSWLVSARAGGDHAVLR